jgi:hypothetical protein
MQGCNGDAQYVIYYEGIRGHLRIPQLNPSAWLSPPPARPDRSAEPHLDHRDEVFSAELAVTSARGPTVVLRRYWSERRLRRESAP